MDLTPLRVSPAYRRLWFGDAFSTFGRHVFRVAVPFQVYDITGSSLAVGLVSLAELVPLVAGSLAGGVVADALDRRRVLLVTQVLLALTSAGLAINAGLPQPALWPIFVLSVVQSTVSGFDFPARRAALPRIVGKPQLPAALALQQILGNLGKLVGPAVGGLLIANADVAAAYWMHVATFAVALIAVAGLPSLPPEGGGRKAGWTSLREGLTYVRGDRTIRSLFIVDINAMVFGLPRALFPAMGTTVLGGSAATVGLLYSAPGAGALLGALTSGWVGRVRRQGLAVLVSVALYGVAITGFGLSRSLVAALAFLALAGAADMVSAVFRSTLLQLRAPDALRGRVIAVNKAVVSGGPQLGDTRAGLVAALTSPVMSAVSGGLACALGVALVTWRYPELKRATTGNVKEPAVP
jgi:MFS family permease